MIALLDSTNDVARLLEPKLHERLPEAVLEIFSSFDALQQRLHRMCGDPTIVILAADSRNQLEQFKDLQRLFVDVRIVLILSDNDTETIRLGHLLYPRYVRQKSNNLDGLVEVVARMHSKFGQVPYG